MHTHRIDTESGTSSEIPIDTRVEYTPRFWDMKRMADEAKNPVKGVEKACSILEALEELNGGRITEVAEHTGIPKGSVHNYLSTLLQEEFVVKDGPVYDIGLLPLDLGGYARSQREVYEVAKPEIKNLAEETGEFTSLLVEEHGWGVYIDRETGPRAVNVDARIGNRVHLHNTALGKAVLAHLPREYVGEILDRRGMPATTQNTITDREELFNQLERIRTEGIAIDDEERLDGFRCVAAPITDTNDDAVAAVSISGPTSRMQGERFEETIPNLVSEASNVIEINLLY